MSDVHFPQITKELSVQQLEGKTSEAEKMFHFWVNMNNRTSSKTCI